MAGDGFEGDEPELEFLMARYSQLIEQQMSTNEIIHTTFYISIVVFGVLIGVVPQFSTTLERGVLSLFAAGVFFAMFLWTRTYLNSRREITAQMAMVIDEIEASDFSFETISPASRFFSDPGDYRLEAWEQNWTKERLLLAYYLGLAVMSLVIPAVALLDLV